MQIAITLLLIAIVETGYGQNTIIGTWKMISGTVTINDSTRTLNTVENESIKIVTPTRFAMFNKKLSNGSLNAAIGGKVTIDNKTYAEIITHSTVKDLLNTTATFTYTLNGKKWRIKGGTGAYKFDQEWERID